MTTENNVVSIQVEMPNYVPIVSDNKKTIDAEKISDEIKELLVNGASSIEIKKKALEEGNYKPLIVDGMRKVLSGVTNLEELNKKLAIF